MNTPESDNGLREFLATRDVACPGCGYNLRGFTGTVCPECKHAPELALRGSMRPSERIVPLLLTVAVFGLAEGAIGLWLSVSDVLRIVLAGSWVACVLVLIWAAIYLCLIVACVVGMRKLWRTRKTDELRKTLDFCVLMIFLYFVVCVASHLFWVGARTFGWFP